MRRSFTALLAAPRKTFLVVRCLNDENADLTYPAAVLEEFIDCYREDPSATDDIKNPFMLPACLQGMSIDAGETLVENAVMAGGDLPCETVELPVPGEVSASKRPLVVLPRVVAGQVVDEPCLSPSNQLSGYPVQSGSPSAACVSKGSTRDSARCQMGDFAHSALKSYYTHFKKESRQVTARNN